MYRSIHLSFGEWLTVFIPLSLWADAIPALSCTTSFTFLYAFILCSSQTNFLIATWTCLLFLSFLRLFRQSICPFFHFIPSVRSWLKWSLFSKAFSDVPSQKKSPSPLNFSCAFSLYNRINILPYIMVISSTLEESPWVTHTKTTLLPHCPTLKLHFKIYL